MGAAKDANAPGHTGTTGTTGLGGASTGATHHGVGGASTGATHHGIGGASTGGTHHGVSGTTGSTNVGPYDSNLANKANPRVDSDLDRSRNAGLNQTTGAGHTSGVSGGNLQTRGVTGTSGSTNAGPHGSNVANKADPRVDSDLDHSRNAGMNQTTGTGYGSGTTPAGSSTTQGPHKSDLVSCLHCSPALLLIERNFR